MSQFDDHLAVVFSDIVGSSLLYSSLGNIRAKEKIDLAILVMSEIVKQDKGLVIKTIGDELMFSHSDPELACGAVVRMNQELNAMHFYLRTGVCYGKVISDHQDIYGDTVNNASFLASTAHANQILLDNHTYSNIISFRKQCEYFDRITLKGQSKQSLIYRLNWEQRNTTSLGATAMVTKAVTTEDGAPTQLLISFEGHTYHIDSHSQISIGRDEGSVQICVHHKNASRKHCSLSYHRGKFILQDHSTNGTYLQQKGHQEVFLRRESTSLVTDGKISIGQPCAASDTVMDYHLD